VLGGVTFDRSAGVTGTADPTQNPSDPEFGVELPAGLRLERAGAAGLQLELQLTAGSRVLAALPRLILVLGLLFSLVQAWRHQVFIAFWFLGLPFFAWLRGPTQRSVLIGEGTLEVATKRYFGRSSVLQRSQIERIAIGRGGVVQLYQRALLVTLVGGRTEALLVGLSAVQAEFVNGGLQRWLTGDER